LIILIVWRNFIFLWSVYYSADLGLKRLQSVLNNCCIRDSF
jgi:hypothetical protein